MYKYSSTPEQTSIAEKRAALREEILNCEPLIRNLKEFAGNDAVYLSSAGNFGDGLIGLGTIYLFEQIGIYPKVQNTTIDTDIPDVNYIIVGGSGGWLDGLWGHYAEILESFCQRGGQVLILPSTVKGFETFFEKYTEQITIFARERVSYEHLASIKGMEDRVYLCHDLAFATDFSQFKIHNPEGRKGTLNLFREDEEARSAGYYSHNYDFSLLWNGVSWSDKAMCVRRLAPLIELMTQFEEIHTDRLHMSVLGTLLGCKVTMYPSGYFKNQAVYEYSLSRFPNVVFTTSNPEDYNGPGHVSRVRDQQDVERLEQYTVENLKLNDSFRNISERYRILNEELQETRERNLNYAHRLDEQSRHPEEDEYAAFFNSRGYRLWKSYNRLYEHRRIGPILRKLRSVGVRLLRKLGILKSN